MNPFEKTIEAYNQTAEEYAKNVQNLHPKTAGDKFVKYALGKDILDIGCGSGRDARIFTSKSFNVTGIDLSEKMVSISKRTSPKSDFVVMDMLNLGLREESFDGVWSLASLLHLPKSKTREAIEETYRVLKTGGVLYIGVKQGTGEELIEDKRYSQKINKFYSYFQPSELEELVSSTGFSKCESIEYSQNTDYIQHPEIGIFAWK